MHVTLRGAEHPVFLEIGLAHTKHIAGALHRRHIGILVGGIRDHDEHVDDRFRGEAGDSGGPDVLDAERARAECRRDALPVQAKGLGPVLPVGHDDDGAFLDPTDEPRLWHRRVAGCIPSLRHRSLPGARTRRCTKSTAARCGSARGTPVGAPSVGMNREPGTLLPKP